MSTTSLTSSTTTYQTNQRVMFIALEGLLEQENQALLTDSVTIQNRGILLESSNSSVSKLTLMTLMSSTLLALFRNRIKSQGRSRLQSLATSLAIPTASRIKVVTISDATNLGTPTRIQEIPIPIDSGLQKDDAIEIGQAIIEINC